MSPTLLFLNCPLYFDPFSRERVPFPSILPVLQIIYFEGNKCIGLTSYILSIVYRAVSPGFNACSVLFVIFPVTFVNIPVCLNKLASSLSLIVDEVSFVNITRDKHLSSFTCADTLLPFPCICRAVRKNLHYLMVFPSRIISFWSGDEMLLNLYLTIVPLPCCFSVLVSHCPSYFVPSGSKVIGLVSVELPDSKAIKLKAYFAFSCLYPDCLGLYHSVSYSSLSSFCEENLYPFPFLYYLSCCFWFLLIPVYHSSYSLCEFLGTM